jgi:hypothetical protein
MYVTAAVLSSLRGLLTLVVGIPKALLGGDVAEGLQSHMELSAGPTRFIGLAEIATTAGLAVGLFWRPLGVAAAVGFALLVIGAVIFHARVGDYANPDTRVNALTPVMLILLSAATAVTLGLSM